MQTRYAEPQSLTVVAHTALVGMQYNAAQEPPKGDLSACHTLKSPAASTTTSMVLLYMQRSPASPEEGVFSGDIVNRGVPIDATLQA